MKTGRAIGSRVGRVILNPPVSAVTNALRRRVGDNAPYLALFALAATAFAQTPLVIAHRGASGYLPEHIRRDELPKNYPSVDALHAAIFRDARADGVFTDFSDVTAAWLNQNATRPRTP